MDEIEQLLQQRASQAAAQPDEIEALLSQRASGSQQPQAAQQANGTSFKPLGSIGNAFYGAAKGAADLVQAPAQLVLNTVNEASQRIAPDSDTSQYLGGITNQFNQYLSDQERQYQEETPGSFSAGTGRVVASALPFVMSGGGSGATQATGWLGKMANLLKTAGQGAVTSSITQPVNDVTVDESGGNNFFSEKAVQAGLGAGGSLVGAGFGKVLGSVINPSISKEAAAALDEGITPTIGQLLGGKAAAIENKFTSAPFVGELIKKAQRSTTEDFNRAAYQRVLGPIGKSADDLPIGYEGVKAVKGAMNEAYDAVLSKVNFRGDQQFGDDLTKIVGMVGNGNLPPKFASQFNSILKNDVLDRMTPAGTMDGKQYKVVEELLMNKIKAFSASQDPDQRSMGNALKSVLDSLKGGLSRSNPEYADELARVNNAYSNYVRVRSAASGTGAHGGVFTPSQLGQAVRSLDKSAGKGASATGTAPMQDLVNIGKNVAPTYPDSGTAGRIWELGTLAALVAQPQYAIPAAVAAAAGSAPYTNAGKKVAATILARRPDAAPQVANALQQQTPTIGSILAAGSVPFFNQNFNNGR